MVTITHAKKAFYLSAVFAGALALSGCCEPNNNCKPSAPAPSEAMPPLLSDSAACLAKPIVEAPEIPEPKATRCPKPIDCANEVKGDLVYNLGQNVISNSSSARLAGGAETPVAIYLPNGVKGRCNPPPDRYYQKAASNQMQAAMASQTTQLPEPRMETSAPISIPGLGFEPLPEPVAGKLPTNDTVAPIETQAPATTVLEPAPAVTPEPKTNQLRPSVNDTPPAVTIPPLIVVEPAPVAPAGAETPAASTASAAFPAESSMGGQGYGNGMPPVPQVSDMDDAVDAVLTRERRVSNSGPTIQLPPSLN